MDSTETSPTDTGSNKPFVSLKWKTLLLVTLGLVLIHLAMVYIHYRDLNAEFEDSLARQVSSYESILRRLLAQSRTSLTRTGAVVPRVVNTVENVSERQELWVSVQFELGLDVLQIYDSRGQLDVAGVANWGGSSIPALLSGKVHRVLETETPAQFLYCTPHCRHFVAQPFLTARGEANVVLTARPLIDVVIEFPQLTGADIAVLAWQEGDRGGVGERLWGRSLSGLSNAPENAPLLQRLQRDYDLDDFVSGARITIDDNQYQFVALGMDRFDGDQHSSFLIFTDIGDPLRRIEALIRGELLLGLFALLATYIVILFVLNRPLKHLQILAGIFPLLAEKRYETVRHKVGPDYIRRRRHDEIDVLDAATVSLANQLEEMEEAIDARSGGLAERMREITTERRLVQSLIDAFPRPIFMLNNEGMVSRMSPAMADLSAEGGSRFMNTPFLSHFADQSGATAAAESLIKVLAGQVARTEISGSFRVSDDDLSWIDWELFHIGGDGRNHVLCIAATIRRETDSA